MCVCGGVELLGGVGENNCRVDELRVGRVEFVYADDGEWE